MFQNVVPRRIGLPKTSDMSHKETVWRLRT
jgi:hypothetical protein